MQHRYGSVLDRIVHRKALRRWREAADRAASLDLEDLRLLRSEARQLDRQLGRLVHEADGRLALPMIGNDAIRKPASADWAWRPAIWRGPLAVPGVAAVPSQTRLGEGATIFHDSNIRELSARQVRNQRERDLAPFGLRMDVFHFDGSFLSLVLDLPTAAVTGLCRRHLIRLDAVVEMEKPLEIFARLNIKQGPNTDKIARELKLDVRETMVEFDLAYTKINEKRVEKIWVDLIFERPEMNQITLRDVTFYRRPRADL